MQNRIKSGMILLGTGVAGFTGSGIMNAVATDDVIEDVNVENEEIKKVYTKESEGKNSGNQFLYPFVGTLAGGGLLKGLEEIANYIRKTKGTGRTDGSKPNATSTDKKLEKLEETIGKLNDKLGRLTNLEDATKANPTEQKLTRLETLIGELKMKLEASNKTGGGQPRDVQDSNDRENMTKNIEGLNVKPQELKNVETLSNELKNILESLQRWNTTKPKETDEDGTKTREEQMKEDTEERRKLESVLEYVTEIKSLIGQESERTAARRDRLEQKRAVETFVWICCTVITIAICAKLSKKENSVIQNLAKSAQTRQERESMKRGLLYAVENAHWKAHKALTDEITTLTLLLKTARERITAKKMLTDSKSRWENLTNQLTDELGKWGKERGKELPPEWAETLNDCVVNRMVAVKATMENITDTLDTTILELETDRSAPVKSGIQARGAGIDDLPWELKRKLDEATEQKWEDLRRTDDLKLSTATMELRAELKTKEDQKRLGPNPRNVMLSEPYRGMTETV